MLTVDAVINLALGVLLAFFPHQLIAFLGLPAVETAFFPSILGAVLIGIGAALLIGRSGTLQHSNGLGLRGAFTINHVVAVVFVA